MNQNLLKIRIENTLQNALVRKSVYTDMLTKSKTDFAEGLHQGALNEVNEQIKDLENILKLF
jgi:hypothetical protein